MKSNIKVLLISLALNLFFALYTQKVSAQQDYVSFQVFYDQLSPYGQWVDYNSYGYVWIPDAGQDFVPYSSEGHWIMTDYGWTWVSDYNWGWAPFHYGRWDYDNSFGWFWVPDNVWGPSWVTWRSADGYYGWEPMEPGVSVNGSFGRAYNSHYDHWIFVRDRDIDRTDINRYYVNRTEHERIVKNSTVINKTYVDNRRHTTYISGPASEDVQKVTGRKINHVVVQENTKPGQELSNGQLRIYRPQVNRNNDKGQKPAPSRITNLKDVKRPAERNVTNQPQNTNPHDNNKGESQQKVSNPANTNSKAQPSQVQKSNPIDNNKQEQHLNTSKPANNNNNVQPAEQHKSTPSENTRHEQPTNTTKPVNNNNNVQPAEQHKSTPPDNTRHEQPTNTVKPMNNNNNVQPAEQHKSNPPDNTRHEQPANSNKNEHPGGSKSEQDTKRTE